MYLSCTNFFLIKWIADLLGLIMNYLYKLFDVMNIANIGLCIIVFTIIIKMIMMPLTIKQQKFTKLSSIMSPELQAIQKKYRGKNDQDSMMKMQQETKAVYAKYGVSQTGGCLQMLIQMPILFALYAVISCVPNYVGDVQNIYLNKNNTGIVDVVYEDIDDIKKLDEIYKIKIGYDELKNDKEYKYEFAAIDNYLKNIDDSKEVKAVKSQIYNYLVGINTSETHIEMIDDMYTTTEELVKKIESISKEEWDKVIADLEAKRDKETNETMINSYTAKINTVKAILENSTEVKKNFADSKSAIDSRNGKIKKIYGFFGIDLSKSPKNGGMLALLIPILSALTQWISMKITTASQNNNNPQENPMASSMKVMNITMPLISAFFCFSLPAGLGLYWVATAVVQIVQQLFINAYFKKVDVQVLIDENIEKQKKKNAKLGIPESSNLSGAAKYNTKNINYTSSEKEDVIDMEEKPSTDKKMGKIASRANMVKEFNEKNNK